MSFGWIALVAPVPLMVEPPPGEGGTLAASPCNDGSSALPLGGGEPEQEKQEVAKGCHGGCLSKRRERSQ